MSELRLETELRFEIAIWVSKLRLAMASLAVWSRVRPWDREFGLGIVSSALGSRLASRSCALRGVTRFKGAWKLRFIYVLTMYMACHHGCRIERCKGPQRE